MNRNITALNFLFDYSIGTLWNIKEDLWKKRINKKESYNSDRKWHPGLSIQKSIILESYELLPMLHGTSKGSNKTSIVVKNVTKHGGKNKRTFFGRIFAPIQISDILFNKHLISNNKYKPHINNAEMEQLKNWLKNKGL